MKTDTIKHYFSRRLFVRAAHIIGICLFLLLGAMPLSAQVYSTSQYGARYDARQNMQYGTQYYGDQLQGDQATQSYSSYQSTVYQPFGSSAPAGNRPTYVSGSTSSTGAYNPITGRRNTESNLPSTDGTNNPNDNPAITEGTTIDNSDGGLQGGGDPGWQGGSPVGEAWVMLLFAAAAAVVVFVRQRKAAVRG